MPAVAAIIQHGTLPTASLTDETSLLVQSVTISGTRDSKEYMGANGSIAALEERNPRVTFTYDAYVSAYTGIPTYNPGQEVTSLANFDDTVLGFAPGDGTLVFKDPVITQSNTDLDKIAFSVVQYPFVT